MTNVRQQVKSKQRIVNHGEVFTNEKEVNAILDLVKSETERIESRFLEPACGNGNFAIEILRRKLEVVELKYNKSYFEYEKYSIIALSSIYGIDILLDNVEECKERLFYIWNKEYEKNCKNETTDLCRQAARYILEKNIICGNALTMKNYRDEPIIFSQWDLITGTLIKRRDYRLDELIKGQRINKKTYDVISNSHEKERTIEDIVPNPIKEYRPVDYRRIQKND